MVFMEVIEYTQQLKPHIVCCALVVVVVRDSM